MSVRLTQKALVWVLSVHETVKAKKSIIESINFALRNCGPSMGLFLSYVDIFNSTPLH